jgi:hypothetical protein
MNGARGPRATLPTIRITYRVVEETIINQGTSTICMWEWEHAAKHSILDVIGGRLIGTPPKLIHGRGIFPPIQTERC